MYMTKSRGGLDLGLGLGTAGLGLGLDYKTVWINKVLPIVSLVLTF